MIPGSYYEAEHGGMPVFPVLERLREEDTGPHWLASLAYLASSPQ